jgi:acetyl-CoA synthetase
MQQVIKTKLNALFRIWDLQLFERLPRTASNKIIRRKLRQDYENRGRKAELNSPGDPGAN